MKKRKASNASTGVAVRPPAQARILVADDHPIFRQGLVALINSQSDLVCCLETATIAETLKALPACKPDLLLSDMRMGSADGLEAIKTIKAQFPLLRILILSQFDEVVYAERALRAGARGYVMKEQATEEVLRAIRSVLADEVYVSPRISQMAVGRILQGRTSSTHSNLGALTDRELHVFKAVGSGKTNKQIAADLNLSVKTIETYREHIKYKLRFANSVEMVAHAKQVAADEGIQKSGSAL